MTKLFIISAGWEQESLLTAAKQLGHHIVATHANRNAEGFKYANTTYVVDPRNILELYDIAVSEKIDGVISDQCDYGYFASAYIADRLGLPGAKLKTAQRVTHKGRTRKTLKDNPHILQPKFNICENIEDAIAAAENIGFPLVAKPTDNRGSIGVTKVEDLSQLKTAYMVALGQSHSREVLIEEFINGTEVAVDGYYLKDTGYRILSIASKQHSPNGLFDNEIVTPAKVSEDVIEKLATITQHVVSGLGVDFGPTHIEYMVTPNKDVYLMEAHNRGGGVYISDKVNPLVSGIDTARCLIQDCLGMPYEDIYRKDKKAHTMIKFITLPPGKLLSAELKNPETFADILVAFKIYASMGRILPPVKDCATRHGFITVCGNNTEELYANFEKVYQHLVLEYQ